MTAKASRRRAVCRGALLGALPLLAACTLEWQNARPAAELARAQQPGGSTYSGWRVFQQRCAGCHGDQATGAIAPDLLPRVREMGERRFVSLVLYRYDWRLPAGQSGEGGARDALIDAIVQRREGALTMPAWQGEPMVEAHIADLYAWLSERAAGTLGPDRPPR